MRSSSEEAVMQFQKWKDESARIFVSSTGLTTFWFVGRVSHAASEVHLEIHGIDAKDFLFSINLHNASFEYRDSREEIAGWKPQRSSADFDSALQVRLKDGRFILFAKLNSP